MPRWSRQHEQLRLKVLEMIERRATPFEDHSPRVAAARRARPLLPWCVAYLPHYFDRPFAPFHGHMAGAVGEPGMPTFVGAFRGAGKSVLLTLARPLRRALNGECAYFLYGSQVQKLAAQNMDAVRLELEHNARLRADYGPCEVSGPREAWTMQPVRRRGSVKFEAFGIGMSPRGRRHGEHRPLEFVGDDLEDAELARNPEREQNLWDWLMDEVLPALEPERFVFTVLGTVFGPECMLERAGELAEHSDADARPLARRFLQPVTERGRSVWPERFPDEALQRMRATVGLRNWLRNYALEPDDPTRPFQARWMATYGPQDVDVRALDVVGFLDPALSGSGCPRALVCVGCDRSTGRRYVLDAWIDRGTPTQMIERLFALHERFGPRVIGIESNGGYALIKPLLGLWEERRGRRLPVRYVNHSRPKALRIEALCAAFEQGRWLFPETPNAGVRALQDQFLAYPHGYVDGPDAAAGCDELLPDTFARAHDDGSYRRLSGRTDFAAL
jgi:predicted phage terminase large subunit-like protein